MNPKVYHTLEFDKIIARLAELADSARGKYYCTVLSPITDIAKIRTRQSETADALRRITSFGAPGFSAVKDITSIRKRLEIGGSLSAAELLTVSALLGTADAVQRRCSTGGDTRDSLSSYFEGLLPCTDLKREIDRCIIAEDEIADDASKNLREIRRKLSGMNEKIRAQMNYLLTGPAKDYLQDAVVTMRDDRYCLPIRAEYKSSVPGVVHDQSSSGQTLFIEPMSVVNMNNEKRELEIAEKKEIEAILAALSARAAADVGAIESDFRTLSELDFIFAKGKLAFEMEASAPVLNEEGRIDLKKARHPLLRKDTVVPIDLNLGITFDQLIITGPNTGGKTVSLKTCGLLTLMAQAGLHIPAAPGSEIAVFHNVYADIGDEQSIEQSLSTFSSHMTNIIRILRSVEQSPNTCLILFDELCAGTDPAEGAALATAILDTLHTEGVRTMATTHYSELKEYALSTAGVENAACEFSLETLSPTYRLLIGVPGKSNAFAISAKLGLPSDITAKARSMMTEHASTFEDLLADLTDEKNALEKSRAEAAHQKEVLESREAKLHADEARVASEKQRLIEEASKEAAVILKRAKDEADQTIREFRKMKADSAELAAMEQKRTKVGQKLAEAEKRSSAGAMKRHVHSSAGTVSVKNLHVGDRVRVNSLGLEGTIHRLPDAKGMLEVQMGIIKSKVSINDIELLGDESTADRYRREMKEKMRSRAGSTSSGAPSASAFGKSRTISPEIRLLGLTADEAIAELDKYIDDASLSHLKEVRIVHGKGTGVLRNAVQTYLAGNPLVKSYHQAAYGEGDAGVTVAELA